MLANLIPVVDLGVFISIYKFGQFNLFVICDKLLITDIMLFLNRMLPLHRQFCLFEFSPVTMSFNFGKKIRGLNFCVRLFINEKKKIQVLSFFAAKYFPHNFENIFRYINNI